MTKYKLLPRTFQTKPITLELEEYNESGQRPTYFIDAELLCRHSHRFEAALRGSFTEARDLIISLNEPAKYVDVFVHWLYTGVIQSFGTYHVLDHLDGILEVYATGDRLLSAEFQKFVAERFWLQWCTYQTIDPMTFVKLLDIAWKKLPERKVVEGNLQNCIFYAAKKIPELQYLPEFIHYVESNPGFITAIGASKKPEWLPSGLETNWAGPTMRPSWSSNFWWKYFVLKYEVSDDIRKIQPRQGMTFRGEVDGIWKRRPWTDVIDR
jgi:hypothetical protein